MHLVIGIKFTIFIIAVSIAPQKAVITYNKGVFVFVDFYFGIPEGIAMICNNLMFVYFQNI